MKLKIFLFLMILFLFNNCLSDKAFDKQMQQFNILMLLMLQEPIDGTSVSDLASEEEEKKRKNKPIPDSQFLGDWSISKFGRYVSGFGFTYHNYYSLKFEDDIIKEAVSYEKYGVNTTYKICGNSDDPFPNFCYDRYEWKIEENQKKVRLLYGDYDKPLYEKWCDINFYLVENEKDKLKVEKNDCGISSWTYENEKDK